MSFEGADGKKVFATESEKDAANSVNRALIGINSNQLVVRTSTYADFAALPLPTGRVNITGIFTRFRNNMANPYSPKRVIFKQFNKKYNTKQNEKVLLFNDGFCCYSKHINKL